MVPPKDAKIIEWPTSIMWFDNEGILYSISKTDPPENPTREESMRQMEEFRKIVGGKKTCMIIETASAAPPPKREDRDWIAREIESVTKAMAIISKSPLSRMVANLFFGLKPPSYPVKFFENEKEAKEWIINYL